MWLHDHLNRCAKCPHRKPSSTFPFRCGKALQHLSTLTRTKCLPQLRAGCDWEGQVPVQDCWTSIDEKLGGREACAIVLETKKLHPPQRHFRKKLWRNIYQVLPQMRLKGDIYCIAWRPQFATSKHTRKTKTFLVLQQKRATSSCPSHSCRMGNLSRCSQTNMTFGIFFTGPQHVSKANLLVVANTCHIKLPRQKHCWEKTTFPSCVSLCSTDMQPHITKNGQHYPFGLKSTTRKRAQRTTFPPALQHGFETPSCTPPCFSQKGS